MAHSRMPVRSESERVMAEHVWRHAHVSKDVEAAIKGTEQVIVYQQNPDVPMHYDPVAGAISPGPLDPKLPGDRVWFRHEMGHHIDMPTTPYGVIRQYSAAPEFGLQKAMAKDVEALAKSYLPDAPLKLSAGDATSRFKQLYGMDLSGVSDAALAHKMAEYAVTGNAAFLKTVENAIRSGAIKDPKLASEMAAFGDMISAVTKNQLGAGHPQTYFQGGFDIGKGYTSRHANETFSNWFALHSSDTQGWRQLMQRFFPDSAGAAQSILDRIGKDVSGQ